MGWGQFLAGMAWDVTKTGVKTSAEAGKKISKKISDYQNKNRVLEQNRRSRNVMVESDLIGHNRLGQIDPSDLLALEKEATPIDRPVMLPSDGQRTFHNAVISGGTAYYRAHAMLKICEGAYMSGQIPILIHCGNRDIEEAVLGSTVVQDKLIINESNSCYDPFLGLSPSELSDRFLHSGSGSVKNNWQFAVLTELIAELYQIRKHRTIPFKTLLQFPAAQIPDKILNTRNAGLIDDGEMMDMNQRYRSAQKETLHLQQYFNRLKTDLYPFYRSHKGSYQDIGKALANGKMVLIDMIDDRSDVFVKMLLQDLDLIRTKGIDFVTCLCDLSLSAYDGTLQDFVLKGGRPFSVSSSDIVSSAGEKLSTLLGYAKDRIYLKHTDGRHADTLSESLGTYKRWRTGYNFSSTRRGLTSDHTSGMDLTEDPAARRIPPQILQNLEDDQMIYQDGGTNAILILRSCPPV